jgi:hypothetical protein
VSGLILPLASSQSPVFLLNSRLGLFTAASLASRRPFSRSYRTILPSSLAVIHSSTLGSSPQPPVSVCGTGCLLRLFLEVVSNRYPRTRRLVVLSLALQRTNPSVRRFSTSPSPFNSSRYRNINRFSIACPFRVQLRSRLTLIRLALFRKPWLFGVNVSHIHYRYSCLHLLF